MTSLRTLVFDLLSVCAILLVLGSGRLYMGDRFRAGQAEESASIEQIGPTNASAGIANPQICRPAVAAWHLRRSSGFSIRRFSIELRLLWLPQAVRPEINLLTRMWSW